MSWYHPHSVRRRAAAVRVITVTVFGILALAFFRAQVLSTRRYRLQSEQNRLRPVWLPAARGVITDRNGVVLADNVPGYSVAVLASALDSLRSTLHTIAPIANLDSARIEGLLQRFQRTPHEPLVLRQDASFELVAALEEQRVVIPELLIQTEPKRSYPHGEIAAHVVGYVGEISEEELTSGLLPGAHRGMLMGRDGLERQYDVRLRGRDGVRFVEVDALGRTVREAVEATTLKPQRGDTLRTSLDIELQHFIAEVFPRGQRGAVMAMDPRTGEVLALYSSPGFDPNAFVGGMDPDEWHALSHSEDQPLFNRAIGGLYPPASPWKLAVAVSALKRGAAGLDSHMEIPCRGGLLYGNRYFRCWKEHGDLSLREAIQFSCDVYFYQLGLKLTLDNLLRDAVDMGFGERSGIDLPGEQLPLFPRSNKYYDEQYGRGGWTNAVTLNLAIGQGENSQSLSNMVRFYAMLASPTGAAPAPRLVAEESVPLRSLHMSPAALAELQDALVQVVRTGTAAGARIAELEIAGKTGTAQNARGPAHGWFLGFAPADRPAVVVGAIVEFAGHGSDVAPLVTRIIARHLLGPDAPPPGSGELEFMLPSDSAPAPRRLLPDTSPLSRPPA